MDAEYFDLYIKYVDSTEEICWLRRCFWEELMYYLALFKRYNQIDLKVNKKSRIEYVRFE